MGRTIIAGFGNTLRGDDGFGVEVIHRLAEQGSVRDDVQLLEVGTAGIRLAQELLTPCDLLVVVDAMTRGGDPGTLYVLDVDSVEPVQSIDMHVAVPAHALSVAQALGVLPPRVVMVGCEPAEFDEMTCELTGELTPRVRLAVDAAVHRIHHLIAMTSSSTRNKPVTDQSVMTGSHSHEPGP